VESLLSVKQVMVAFRRFLAATRFKDKEREKYILILQMMDMDRTEQHNPTQLVTVQKGGLTSISWQMISFLVNILL
jgi:hypothetical protein